MLIPASEIVFPLIILLSAYIIFGIAGFGTALIAAPLLAFYMPVAEVIPFLALLDFAAALLTFLHGRKDVCWPELKRIVPLMMIGSVIGVAILLYSRPDILLPMLGLFVVAYSLYALIGTKTSRSFSKIASIPFGLVGGVFSSLFGSGGFLYAIYLLGRLRDKASYRVTQSFLIKCSTLTRTLLFLFAGVYNRSFFSLPSSVSLP